jgi:predicted GNAT superfamily acetyltransferase
MERLVAEWALPVDVDRPPSPRGPRMERLVAEWALPVDVDRPPSPRGPRMERFLGRAAGSS